MKTAIDYARDDLGVWEWKDGHNPKVVQYFSDVGHDWVKDDETAWCAAFVGAMLRKAGLPHTGKLNARSYLEWGEPVSIEDAKEGDIVIFSRGNPDGWQGHVAFLVGLNGSKVDVLGGNQANQINIKTYSTDRLLGIRRFKQDPENSAEIPTTSITKPLYKSKEVVGGLSAVLTGLGAFMSGLGPTAQTVAVVALVGLGCFFIWNRMNARSKGER